MNADPSIIEIALWAIIILALAVSWGSLFGKE